MRITYCLSHPIQYQSPLMRHLCANGIDIEVCYAADAHSRTFYDEGFSKQISWDIPLLDGYPYKVLNSVEPKGSRSYQIAHYSKQLDKCIQDQKPSAIWAHGWRHPFSVAAWDAAIRHQVPLLLRGETFLGCVRGGRVRRLAHKFILSRRFRQVSAFLAVGTLNHQMYRAYGVVNEKIFSMPYAVDNTFFRTLAVQASSNRERLRCQLGIESGRPIVLFCGKLIEVKDPVTLIQAVGEIASTREAKPVLLIAGDGALRSGMEELAGRIAPGIVKFLGFRNQTELPALYDLCDVFVLPSVFEPWGLVVNEVMNAGKPVIVSDQVGSGYDLVKPGINGDIFRARDASDLCNRLRPWLENPDRRESGGNQSLEIIRHWSFDRCLEGLKMALSTIAGR